MELRRLLPEAGTATPAQAAAHLTARRKLVLNMVASADGRAAHQGRSGGIEGGSGDRELFHALRAHADAILVGTGTLAAERYGAWIRDERRWAMRAEAGLTEPPVGVTLTRSGRVPWDIPLFASGGDRVLVYTEADVSPPPAVTARVEVIRMARAEPGAVVADLRARGVRSILCEGGPTLNAGLLEAGVVDELHLTVAPQLLGGTGALTIVEGPLPADVALEPADAYACAGALLLRYRVARAVC